MWCGVWCASRTYTPDDENDDRKRQGSIFQEERQTEQQQRRKKKKKERERIAVLVQQTEIAAHVGAEADRD